jgi:hypothetical protein
MRRDSKTFESRNVALRTWIKNGEAEINGQIWKGTTTLG